jgi:hypothetical protein
VRHTLQQGPTCAPLTSDCQPSSDRQLSAHTCSSCTRMHYLTIAGRGAHTTLHYSALLLILSSTLLCTSAAAAPSLQCSCSLLSLAPDMITLPTGEGGLAATASQAELAAGEAAGGEGEQDGAASGHATRSSRESMTGAATATKDLLVGHRCV